MRVARNISSGSGSALNDRGLWIFNTNTYTSFISLHFISCHFISFHFVHFFHSLFKGSVQGNVPSCKTLQYSLKCSHMHQRSESRTGPAVSQHVWVWTVARQFQNRFPCIPLTPGSLWSWFEDWWKSFIQEWNLGPNLGLQCALAGLVRCDSGQFNCAVQLKVCTGGIALWGRYF